MKKADKYPAVDPRLPRLYDRVLEAAQLMRRARHAENVAHFAVVRAQRIASLQPLVIREATAEAVLASEVRSVPDLTPDDAISGV